MQNNISDNLPFFVGIGGHKCASTWLSECMRDHPDICMSNPKEVGFFCGHFDKGMEWYLSHWQDADGKKCGEFTSFYLYDPVALKRIKEHVPHVKIVAVIREPVSRARSQIMHGIRGGEVRLSGSRIIDKSTLRRIQADYPIVVERSLYLNGLQLAESLFGNDNMLIFNQSDFESSAAKCLKVLWQFLGVDADFLPARTEKKISPGIVPRCQKLEDWRIKIYSIFRKHPWVVPRVRKLRLAELYRRLNRGNAIDFAPDAIDYLNELFRDDWEKSLEYVVCPKKRGTGSTPGVSDF